MIITRNGEIITHFFRSDGIVVKDGEFSICLEYSDVQKQQSARIRELKKFLADTDYKAMKYSEGIMTETEYLPIKEEREKWRAEINKIEETFSEPTITKEEIRLAEEKAMMRLMAQTE